MAAGLRQNILAHPQRQQWAIKPRLKRQISPAGSAVWALRNRLGWHDRPLSTQKVGSSTLHPPVPLIQDCFALRARPMTMEKMVPPFTADQWRLPRRTGASHAGLHPAAPTRPRGALHLAVAPGRRVRAAHRPPVASNTAARLHTLQAAAANRKPGSANDLGAVGNHRTLDPRRTPATLQRCVDRLAARHKASPTDEDPPPRAADPSEEKREPRREGRKATNLAA